jgi:hypothetical protein
MIARKIEASKADFASRCISVQGIAEENALHGRVEEPI